MLRLLICTLATAAILVMPVRQSWAVTSTGRVRLYVMRTLAIESLSDLVFSPASAGAPAATIDPMSSEAATFLVHGEPNTVYYIRIPTDTVISTGGGGENETILINEFASYPATSGLIGADGQQTLRIGATRPALSPQQAPGAYTGSYTVEVIY